MVLPQVASALNPTGWGTVAVTLLLALVGASVQQWTARTSPEGIHWRRWFAICLVGSVVVLVGTAILYFAAPRVLRKPRSVSDQINAQLDRLIDHGRNHVVVNERLQLHPSDDASWVVVIENAPNSAQFYADTVAGRPAGSPMPTSDELRIYDVVDGWLTLKLDYRPAGRGTTARQWVPPAGAPSAFDYNGNGFPEIIAGYSLPDAWGELLPFAVDWTGVGYRLVSMTPNPPVLPTSGFAPRLVVNRRIWYLTRVRLPDAVQGSASTQPLVGYQVGAFAFVGSPAVRLLTGYFAALPSSGRTQVLELRSNQISLSDFHLTACHHGDPYCEAPSDERDVEVPPSKILNNGLLAGWEEVKSRWAPVVRVKVAGRQDCPACD